jgi:tetratricopeptide (TPR) repeat protein
MEIALHRRDVFSGKEASQKSGAKEFFRRLSAPFRAYYHASQATSLFFKKHDYAGAIGHCDKVLLCNSGNPLAYLIKGASYYRLGEYWPAIDALSKAAELNHAPGGPNIKEIDKDAAMWVRLAETLLIQPARHRLETLCPK